MRRLFFILLVACSACTASSTAPTAPVTQAPPPAPPTTPNPPPATTAEVVTVQIANVPFEMGPSDFFGYPLQTGDPKAPKKGMIHVRLEGSPATFWIYPVRVFGPKCPDPSTCQVTPLCGPITLQGGQESDLCEVADISHDGTAVIQYKGALRVSVAGHFPIMVRGDKP